MSHPRTCEFCAKAVFGAIGSYCEVDKHEIKSTDKCSNSEFECYQKPEPTNSLGVCPSLDVDEPDIDELGYGSLYNYDQTSMTIDRELDIDLRSGGPNKEGGKKIINKQYFAL